jgi:hypothetical protein
MLGDVEMNQEAPTVSQQHQNEEDAKGRRSTVKKSTDTSSLRWLLRKAFQV